LHLLMSIHGLVAKYASLSKVKLAKLALAFIHCTLIKIHLNLNYK